MSTGRGAEGGVREAEGGDENAAEPEPEGEGQCMLVSGHSVSAHHFVDEGRGEPCK